jgi:hypothetical protein
VKVKSKAIPETSRYNSHAKTKDEKETTKEVRSKIQDLMPNILEACSNLCKATTGIEFPMSRCGLQM